MIEFIKQPNLPDKKISLAALSCNFSGIIAALNNFSIKTIKIYNNQKLDGGVRSHADMNILHLGENKIIANREQGEAVKQLKSFGFEIIYPDNIIKKDYPDNVALNSVIINDKVICKYNNTEKKLKEFITKKNYRVIDVKQGYSKCSVCIVNENSIITSDESIKSKAVEAGLNVLKISSGYIKLPGYDYGFIGGCSGFIDKNKLAFTGNVFFHPDGKRIADFCNNLNVEIICLSDDLLVDVGSIIPLAY